MVRLLHWGVLIVLSAVFVVVLELVHMPAALLLGPMAAGVVVATAGGVTFKVPMPLFVVAQGIIGMMIARTINASILGTMLGRWPLFLSTIVAVIAISSLLGWSLTRLRILPGTVAVWGSSPGAATTMTLMAGAYGADMRLVAFMQYLRVVLVTIVAALVTHFWTTSAHGPRPGIDWFPPLHGTAFALTLALAMMAAFAGRRLRIQAGALLLPMAIGGVLHVAGGMTIELPPWLLAASYLLVGWNIGLGFTRAVLRYAAIALPRIVASILVQVGACGGLAVLLHYAAGIDALTAYLATSPGGADSVAIIAASAKVDVPFVMAMQITRFLMVIAISPWLARFISRRVAPMEALAVTAP
jgi:membrane AbrB-like protein